jgi:hypothetical protein
MSASKSRRRLPDPAPSSGFKLRDMATALRHFVFFMEREGACTITTNLALRWAMQPQQVHRSLGHTTQLCAVSPGI